MSTLPSMSLCLVAQTLLGPGVAVAGGAVAEWVGPLFAVEEKAVARASAVRRHEFAAGRSAARWAMKALQFSPTSLPRCPDGPVLWPNGITGSITHGGGYVLAAVGRLGPDLHAIGVDLESCAPLGDDLAAEICRSDEDASDALRIFSAKEAAYKAQYMITRRLLDYSALRITFRSSGRFQAEFTCSVGHFARGDYLSGRQLRLRELLFSVVQINGNNGL